MGKFSGVLLASDYDDTFIAHDGIYPARNARALDYFTAEGGRFTLATGRGHGPVSRLVSRFPINAPVIETNGTRIYDFQSGQELYAATMDPSIAPLVAELMADFPLLSVECFAGDGIYVERPNFVAAEHAQRIGQVIPERPMQSIPQPWTKLLLQEHHDYLLPIQARIQRDYGDRFEALFSMPTYLEVFRKGCSKGAALLELAQRLQIDPADTYAVGDGDNDISMLRAAGDSFCCGGGSEAAKAAAGHVVGLCADGALADVVDYLDRIYPR